MTFIQNHEADETPSTWPVCDRCHEQAEDWCLSCLKEEAERMREEEDRDAEMRSLKGYSDLERERI